MQQLPALGGAGVAQITWQSRSLALFKRWSGTFSDGIWSLGPWSYSIVSYYIAPLQDSFGVYDFPFVSSFKPLFALLNLRNFIPGAAARQGRWNCYSVAYPVAVGVGEGVEWTGGVNPSFTGWEKVWAEPLISLWINICLFQSCGKT